MWEEEYEIGTKEPGDPSLEGWEPSHPSYYKLGGRPLRPDEIEAANFDLDHYVKYSQDKRKYGDTLLKAIASYENELEADIQRYENGLNNGKVSCSFYLLHNHISASKGHIKATKNELALLSTPGMLCEGQVRHIIKKWLGKKVDEYTHEKGHLGGVTGGGDRPVLCLTTSPDKWDEEIEAIVEQIRAGGWSPQIEHYEVKEKKLVSVKVEVPLILAEERKAKEDQTEHPCRYCSNRKMKRDKRKGKVIPPPIYGKCIREGGFCEKYYEPTIETRIKEEETKQEIPQEPTPGPIPQAKEQLKLW